ncbi:MAG: hypothetical protein JW839_03000 [Candidatus Lokiarchaeota archaeon]|nr:hypothetical protein [Candidatus Lokiarchaeota archaeon]
MTAGICVGTWDDAIGLKVHAEYPNAFRKENRIQDSQLLNIFNERIVHDVSGFAVYEDASFQIATYYTPLSTGEEYEDEGEEKAAGHGIVFLFLDKEKKVESIKEQFIEFSIFILKLINNNDFPELFFNIIDNFSFLEPLTDEQRVAALYNSDARGFILQKLAERPCSRNELEVWLRQEYDIAAIDLQGLLVPFFKMGIVKQSYEASKGRKRKELFYFLVKDVYLFRIPPKRIIDAVKRGKIDLLDGGYYDEVKDFFEEYELTPGEINKLGILLAIPNLYKIVTMLREDAFELDELRIDFLDQFNYMPSNFAYLLKLLEKSDIVKIYKRGAGNKKVIVLKSDIQFQFFFPEYLVDNIRKAWREGVIDKGIALKHLTLLRDEYLENFMKLNGNGKHKPRLSLEAALGESDEGMVGRINILRKMELLLRLPL